jgi:AAA domain
VNGFDQLMRDIDRPDLIGEGLNGEVAAAIADNYPPSGHVPTASSRTGARTGYPHLVAAVPTTATSVAHELGAFLAEPDPEHDWIVPKLLERGDRVILTGREGDGKSTLLRQFGVQVASGVHPFTLEPIEPVSVLLVDCENGRRHLKRKLRPLYAEAGDRYVDRVHVYIAGDLDLLTKPGRDLLDRLHRDVEPDLTLIGPTYKLAGGDPTKEEVAREVAGAIDKIRAAHGTAFLIEAHTPYTNTNGKREIRPYGASLWSRWPEFGVFLHADGKLEHWRGPRDERDWPARLQRDGSWPWTVAEVAPEDGEPWKPTALMERASAKLAELNAVDVYPSRSGLQGLVSGKKQYMLVAIGQLVTEGYVAEKDHKLTHRTAYIDPN